MSTALIGILNLTPDSFSDGGQAGDAKHAFAQFTQLLKDGAAIVDVGAESTRPGATSLTAEEEWARLLPFFEEVKRSDAKLFSRMSVDTRHGATASKALVLGVRWINDVTGFQNAEMIEAVKGSNCDIAVMHSLSVPADPKVTLPRDADPVQVVLEWAAERAHALEQAGISKSRIILDPGIGFGKSAMQSAALIERITELKALGLRLLVGHSRKSFLTLYTDVPPAERDGITARISAELASKGVDYLRVHNVRMNREQLEAA